MTRRIAIMSDHPVVRVGLRTLVADTGAQVILETGVRNPVPVQLHRDSCDGIVLEVGTAHVDVSLAMCEAAARNPEGPPLIGVECCGREPPWIFRIIGAGLAAYVSLAAESAGLADVLEAACRGEPLIRLQHGGSAGTLRERMTTAQKVAKLSSFDLNLLQLSYTGLKDREIAVELKCGVSTVKHHVEALAWEFDARNRFHLGVWAHEWGLVGAEWSSNEP